LKKRWTMHWRFGLKIREQFTVNAFSLTVWQTSLHILINVYWNKYGLIQTDATIEIVVYSRKVRTIFILKIIVNIFVKFFLILVLHLRQFFIVRIFVKRATDTIQTWRGTIVFLCIKDLRYICQIIFKCIKTYSRVNWIYM
jgi:hypothetical protein